MFKKLMLSTLVMCVLFAGPGFATLDQEATENQEKKTKVLTRNIAFDFTFSKGECSKRMTKDYKDSSGTPQTLTAHFEKPEENRCDLYLESTEDYWIFRGNSQKPKAYNEPNLLVIYFNDKGEPISYDGLQAPPSALISHVNFETRKLTILTEIVLDLSGVRLQ